MRILTNQKYSIFGLFVSAGHEGPNCSNVDEHFVWTHFQQGSSDVAHLLFGSRFGAESEDSSKKLIIHGYREIARDTDTDTGTDTDNDTLRKDQPTPVRNLAVTP